MAIQMPAIADCLCMTIGRETMQDLAEEIYSDLHDIVSLPQHTMQKYFSQRAILAARNVDVDSINETVLQRLSEHQKEYISADSAFNDAETINDAISNEY